MDSNKTSTTVAPKRNRCPRLAKIIRSFLGLPSPEERALMTKTMSLKNVTLFGCLFGAFTAMYIGVGVLAVGAFTIIGPGGLFGRGMSFSLFTCGFDVLFFVGLYVLSDIFAEVFGYKATRVTGLVAMAASITVFSTLYIVTKVWPVTVEYGVWGWLPASTLVMTVGGSVIFMCGDWINDAVHHLFLRKDKQKLKVNCYGNYVRRTVFSSFAGRLFDALCFTLVVAIPLMVNVGEGVNWAGVSVIDWGWGSVSSAQFWITALIGNVVLQVVLQIVLELVTSFFSFRLVIWLKKKVDANDLEVGIVDKVRI